MIRDIVEQFVRGRGEKTWEHDRTKTVGASEIGLCERKVWAVKKEGQKNNDHIDTWGARVRGTTIEEQLWVPAMRQKFGDKFMVGGAEQQTLQLGHLSCTPDGRVIGLPRTALRHLGVKDLESNVLLVECKSIDPRVNLTEAKHENMMQVQVQLGLTRALTKYRPMWALISYTDASFWNEIDEYPIRFDQKMFEGAQARATRILTAKSMKDLKPEGWIAGGKECEYCPFTKACNIIRRSVPEKERAADPQFVAEMTDAAREYQQLQEAAKMAEAAVREKSQEMKDRMREKQVRRIPGVITWSTVKGRLNWDFVGLREAAEARGINLDDYSTAGEPTDRLQVSLPNGSGKKATATAAVKQRKRKR